MSDGFEAICDFSDTRITIYVVLFKIERPSEYEGWH